ncbi:MAG: hypothetical protein DRG11_05365 [Epsilonproteobacteria bacterium]|nr:MAG: hypothetical protein DRG11_05365 [Campylobacterota bacterium]
MRFFFTILLFALLLLTGCNNTKENKKDYDTQAALDSGDFDKVINTLGDCSQFGGHKQNNCYLDISAAYFGKAGFDVLSLAKEFTAIDDSLADDIKSKEFNKIIFSKLDDENLKIGLTYLNILVGDDTSICNEKDYNTKLTKIQKQACLSINPMLISSLSDDDKNAGAASLEDIIKFKDVIKDAVPELESEDIVSIIDGDNLEQSKDANNNDKLDSLEATNFALKVFANGNTTYKGSDGNVSSDFNRTITYAHTSLNTKTLKMTKIKIDGSGAGRTDNFFYRVVDTTTYNPDYNTTLTTLSDVVCDRNNDKLPNNSLNDITDTSNNTVLPCIKLNEDGNATNLNDSVVNLLNDDDMLKTIALSKDSESDDTDDEKVIKFKKEMCEIDNANAIDDTNTGKCEWDVANSKLIINQDAFIDYMNKDK